MRSSREITRFGAPASAAGLLHVGITNVDYAVLAARLSSTQVGLYWRAFQLGVSYQDKISGIMLRLAFPIYSRTRDLSEMRRLHERATRIHGAVVVPLLAVLIVTAPDIVPALFGSAWERRRGTVAGARGRRDDRRDPHRLPAGDAGRRPTRGRSWCSTAAC